MERVLVLALGIWLCAATLSAGLAEEWVRPAWSCGAYALAVIVMLWRRRITRWYAAVAGAPAAVGLLQLAGGATVNAHETSLAVLGWGAVAAVALVSGELCDSSQNRDRLLRLGAAFAGLTGVFALVQPYLGDSLAAIPLIPAGVETAATFANRNTYASFVEVMMPVAVYVAVREPEARWIWWSGAAAMAASVIASGSRAGAILVSAEMVLLVWIAGRALGHARTTSIVAGAVVLSAVAVAGWEKVQTRMQYEDPWKFRRNIAASAWAMTAERPVTGFGLGAFADAYPRFATFDTGRKVNHAHNDWIELLSEGGAGMAVWAVVVCVWAALTARRKWWSVGVVFVFAHAAVDYPLQRIGVAAWVWALLAAASAAGDGRRALRRRDSEERSARPAPEQSAHPDRFSATGAR